MSRPLSGYEVINGKRAELERRLMWAVALDADPERIERLLRMVTPAANDDGLAAVAISDVSVHVWHGSEGDRP